MPLKIWTAHYRYPGPHRLDITVKGKDPLGSLFAPNWGMVTDYKKTGDRAAYENAYYHTMLNSYNQHRDIWTGLLQRNIVVLVCFCAVGEFCHRLILPRYLEYFGATYIGEIQHFDSWAIGQKLPPIDSFSGEFDFLSNFAYSPMMVEGKEFVTNEHYFQFKKAFIPEQAEEIRLANVPAKAKKLARKCVMRPDWDTIKDGIMWTGLVKKFKDPVLLHKLLSTRGRVLIEGNYWHDNYWGDCSCEKCRSIPGKNKLGTMLMKIRGD